MPARWLRPFADWAPLQVLTAGHGSGKTVALRHCHDAVPASHLKVWLSLEGGDWDTVGLFRTLLHGIRQKVPGFGEGLLGRLVGPGLEARGIWLALTQELQTYAIAGLVVLLDDVHVLDGEADVWLASLVHLLARRPPHLRGVIASRRHLNLGLSKLEAQGIARILGPQALHWQPEEVADWLTRRGGDQPALNALAERLEGWPLGLILLTRGHQAPESAFEAAAGPTAIAAYLAEDVYAACAPEQRTFLRRLALLTTITPAAAHVLCPELEVEGLLAQAERAHLIQRLEGGLRFRFPAYLHDFLRVELTRCEHPDQLRQWHRQLMTAHISWQQPEEAFSHALAADAWGEAMAAAHQIFPAMRYDGRIDTIARRLSAFPENAAQNLPLWWLWRGHVLAHTGDYDSARQAYLVALQHSEAGNQQALCAKLQVVLANLALNTGDDEGLRSRLTAAQRLQTAGWEEDRVDLALLQAALAEREGDLVRMQHENEAVLAVPCGTNVELIASHGIALRNLFSLAYHRGDRVLGLRHLDAMVAHATSHRLPAYRLFAEFMRALLHLEEGEAALADQFFRSLPTDWQEQLDWFDRSMARIALAEWHTAHGRWLEGERELKLSQLALADAGMREGSLVPLERLIWLRLRHGGAGDIEDVLLQAGEGALLSEGGWPSLNLHGAGLMLAVARSWQQRGEASRAEVAYQALGDRLAQLSALGYAARARLLQASACLAQGKREAAHEAYTAARRLSVGSLQATCPDRAVWLELAPLLAAESLSAQPSPPPDSVGLPAESGHPRQAGALPTPEMSTPPESPAPGALPPGTRQSLELRGLGTFEVRVDGIRIEAWPRKRAQHLLQALLLYPRGLTRPALAEAIGEQSADGLRTAWSALRKILEPDLGARAPSRFLYSDDERCGLVLEQISYCDVHAFEKAVTEAARLEATDPSAAAGCYSEAVRHVRGPLQGGESFSAEREAIAGRARAAWLWLVEYHQRRGDGRAAESVLQDASSVAPDDEAICLALMKHHHQQARTDRVRLTYWDFRKALNTLQGLKPSEELERFYRELSA